MKRKYSVIVIPEQEAESFSLSTCDCKECVLIHMSQIEWGSFKPITALQKRMIDVVSNIEKNIKDNKKSTLLSVPKRLKS